jgi:hypothetical protein
MPAVRRNVLSPQDEFVDKRRVRMELDDGVSMDEDQATGSRLVWFRGEVDEAGQFQWPDGGYQEVRLAKGEWAGPIEEPAE